MEWDYSLHEDATNEPAWKVLKVHKAWLFTSVFPSSHLSNGPHSFYSCNMDETRKRTK